MSVIVSPSLLAADFMNLGKDVVLSAYPFWK